MSSERLEPVWVIRERAPGPLSPTADSHSLGQKAAEPAAQTSQGAAQSRARVEAATVLALAEAPTEQADAGGESWAAELLPDAG